MNNLKYAVLAGAMALPLVASAQSTEWYLNPAIGYQVFDGKRDAEGAAAVVLGVEAKFNQNWGIELLTLYSEPENDAGNDDFDAKAISGNVSLLRYFQLSNRQLQPYAALGAGHGVLNYEDSPGDDEDTYTQYNAGGGFRYQLAENFFLRADARYLYGADDETSDGIVSLGFSYRFAGGANDEMILADADGDGVADNNDACPGTPAGEAVDRTGCPLDNDGDGVPNYLDKCPASPAGQAVDKSGCGLVLTSTESIKLDIKFALDSSVIPESYKSELEKVASFMKQNNDVKAVVEGHADSTGGASYNMGLSQRRADAVRSALISNYGIEPSRVSAVGYGEERPIASNDNAEGRAANRRVVAVVEISAGG